MKITLSKTAFVTGLQCHKALYLKKHQPRLADEVTDALQAIFDMGTDVGQMATGLFPGGTDLSELIPSQIGEVLYRTRDLIGRHETIYEAGFYHFNLMCFMDILVPSGNKWKAYEVKGSTSNKEVFVRDAAFQYNVMKGSGLDIEDISIVYINKDYEKNGDIDIKELFVVESVLDEVKELQPNIVQEIRKMFYMLKAPSVPDIQIGEHCLKPYKCSFFGHCWKDIPEASVFELSNANGKDFDLFDSGILNLKDIPDDVELTDLQRVQVESGKSGEVKIDKAAVRSFVNGLAYPLHFLDFETFSTAVPMFNGTRPYQQIPFQYSLHVQEEAGGLLKHKEFLAANSGDTRKALLEKLIDDLGNEGDVIVYTSFEASRLNDLAKAFPEYATSLNQIIERLVDLSKVFSTRIYYHPEMKGSYSIKNVLPALVPEFSYDELAIADGMTAALMFRKLYDESNQEIIDNTRKDLLEYCRLDTLAMVEILKVLRKV